MKILSLVLALVIGFSPIAFGAQRVVLQDGDDVETGTIANPLIVRPAGDGGITATMVHNVINGTVEDTLIKTGACTVYGITVASATAGDYVYVYDAVAATGYAKFEVYVGIGATSTQSLMFPVGVSFATGIFADVTDDEVHAVVIYDD